MITAKTSKVNFCIDTYLVESILSDSRFYKKAGFVSDLLEKVKDYFNAHIDKEHPVESVLQVLAPGALWVFLHSIGLGKWGFLLGLLADVFHVNIPGMLQSLFNNVKQMISGGQKVSSEQIDGIIESTAQEFSIPGTPQEVQEGYQKLKDKQTESSQSDDGKVYSSLELLNNVKMIKLALIEYEYQTMRLTKEADAKSFFGQYNSSKSKGTSLLARIFGWIIKIALFSAGLMVAGDVVNAVLGRPSALTGTYQAGQEKQMPAPQNSHRSTQTKFPFKTDSAIPSAWPMVNNLNNIENMLIQFSKDTYSDLDGKESFIRSSPAFQAIKEDINWFNIHNPNSAQIFVPPHYTSKKQLVDYFIDDVARRAK